MPNKYGILKFKANLLTNVCNFLSLLFSFKLGSRIHLDHIDYRIIYLSQYGALKLHGTLLIRI